MLFFGCLIMSMASIFIGFCDNIWMCSALRFLSGYGRAAVGPSVLVLCSESVGKQYQGKVGTIGFFMSTFEFMSLPGLAYVSRNYSWRVECCYKWILVQLLLVLSAGFRIGLMYYGMPLGLGNGSFSLNLYLSTGLNALQELPAFLIVFFLVEKCKRRSTLLGLSISSGVCGMLCMVASEWKVLYACTAFDLLLIYTTELFPTSIRSATVSIVWQAVVLAVVVSPVLVDAGGDNSNKILPYLVLGIMTSIAGSLVIFLPEILGFFKDIEKQEQKGIDESPYVMNGVWGLILLL
ncbi:unnamed protein product [Withania somnifera]